MNIQNATGPKSRVFSAPFRVYYEDTDSGGVVYYSNYLKFAERARTEALRELGLNQSDIHKETGSFFVVKKCTIDYIAPSGLDDQLIVDSVFFDVLYTSLRVEQKIKKDGRILATLEVLIAFVKRIENGTVVPVKLPEEIRKVLKSQ